MWQDLLNWTVTQGFWPLLGTAVSVAVCAALYFFLRHRIRNSKALPSIIRKRITLLGLCFLLVLLFILVRVWTGALMRQGIVAPNAKIRYLLENVLWTLGVGAAIYIIATAARHALTRSDVTIESRHNIRMATTWISLIVFIIAAAFIWLSGVENFGVFLGIIGAGIALSLQETLVCIAGWLVLVVRRPFGIGDRIEIDGRIGDVIGVSVFQTVLLEVGNWVQADQSTGRMLIIPNSMLIRKPMYNYSKGFPFIWNEISTTVTFESEWEKAKEIMLQQAQQEAEKIENEVQRRIRQMQARYAIRYGTLTPIVYTSVAASGVQLTLRYLSPVRQRRATVHRISEAILKAFISHADIDLAYPTTRIYRNNEEGKVNLGGPRGDKPQEPGTHAMG